MRNISHDTQADIANLLMECGAGLSADATIEDADSLLANATEQLGRQVETGSIYTEKNEAAFMCWLALSEWLAGKLDVDSTEIYRMIDSGRVDLSVARALQDVRILDPACGAGVFLIEMYELLRRITAWPPSRILCCLNGMDSDPLALRAAGLRLALRAGGEEGAHLTFLDSLDPISFDGKYDIVIGNPPYVRQERICDPLGTTDRQDYKKKVLHCLAELFPGMKIDGRSDMLLYFYLRALSLLSDGGVCCLITSGSWLDAGFGESLRRLFAERFSLRLVIEDDTRKIFPQASVNPVISLVSASNSVGETRFISITGSSGQGDLKSAVTGNCGRYVPKEMLLRRPHKWGSLHLKASPLAMELMDSGLLAPLAEHSMVRKIGRGVRTGKDAFFCLRKEQAEELRIERRYLTNLVKSPMQFLHRPPVTQEDDEWLLLVCPRLRTEISLGGALRYIEQAKIDSHCATEGWWALEIDQPADILLPVGFGERLFVVANSSGAVAHQRFATLYVQPESTELMLGLLRCSITLYFAELYGRKTLGEGALDIPPADWRLVMVPKVQMDVRDEIIRAAAQLHSRPCLPVRQEMMREDQFRLDAAVAAAIGLDERTMARVRQELIDLVGRRLAKVKAKRRN